MIYSVIKFIQWLPKAGNSIFINFIVFLLIRSKINGAKKSCISIASVPGANQFLRWQPISWPGNCTLPPVLQHRWDYNFSFGVLLTLTNFLKAILSKFLSKSGQILKKNAGKIDQFSWPVNCTLPTVLHQRWKKIFLGGGLIWTPNLAYLPCLEPAMILQYLSPLLQN